MSDKLKPDIQCPCPECGYEFKFYYTGERALTQAAEMQWWPISEAPLGEVVWVTAEGVFPNVSVEKIEELEVKYYEEKHQQNGVIKQIPRTKKVLVDAEGCELDWPTHYMIPPALPNTEEK